jgi:acyl-coenzyme A thioesterase PaaI-like protein
MLLDYTTTAPDESSRTFDQDGKRMTETTTATLESLGWEIVDTSGFLHLIGPLWQRLVGGTYEYAIVAEDKHHNRRGLVQGGVIMTFADRACGMTARFVSGKPHLATVQLDVHFVDAGKIGEMLVARPHVVRTTKSLIFITTEVTAEGRVLAMASGVFKILKNE